LIPVNAPGKYEWLYAVILFGVAYLFVGVAFPNPPASNKMQFIWRLGAWLICVAVFAIHIGLEHFRLRNSSRRTALHVSVSVAFGAFGLAAAANIHGLTARAGNQRLLAMALVIWPIITALPAFVVALAATAVLARIRPNREPRIT
jgi:uncharacterized membrane protein YbhN (UPF0104 family)